MKHTILLLTLLLSFFCHAQQKDLIQFASQADMIMSKRFKANEPGSAAIVARRGQVIYKKAFGMANLELDVPMQPDNVFRIGSITKQFTAVAVLQLMEQGKLSLQDTITRFIPDYPMQHNRITIEHLLTHTSGIQSYTDMKDFMDRITLDQTPVEIIDHFKNEPMRFTPGTKWEYSNSNYFLLGYIIEKITGKPYPEYLEQNFFKPLGMSHTLYGSDEKIIKNRAAGYSMSDSGFENTHTMSMTQPYAAGSIQSTVEDLFKWNQAIHSYKLLKKQTLDKAFTNYKLNDGKESGYGYGWSFGNVQGSEDIEHGGAINGFRSVGIYLPKEDVFVAVFTNCDSRGPEDAAARLAAIAIGKPYEQKEIALDAATLPDYAGVYENETGEQRIISAAGNKLYSQRGRNQKFLIRASEKDKFFFDDALMTIAFSRNDKGAVDKLTTIGRHGTEVWTKTDKPQDVKAEIKLDEKILEAYVGQYEVNPQFGFAITREQNRIFEQATHQSKIEIFAETENKFFLKVVDAQIEFIKDASGKVTKAVLKQGGKEIDAKRVN
jgi:CubicO group peptidase (beta-lactamase class C family)